EDTAVTQREMTENNGTYRFSLVPPGVYTVTIKAGGFTTREIKGIKVDASTTVPVNATLSVASSSTTVEVTTATALVQTATSDLTTTVNTRTIENTPLIQRNVFDLAFLAPSVSQGMNFGPASGGARESGTAYLLNGGDNNNNFSEGASNIVPPLETVAEFTVLTNNMSAQYGRGAGAVVSAIQKSGGNRFHGVAYEFLQNTALNAADFFSNRDGNPKPKYQRNQFGGEIDGPIKKDKTFFAFGYDQVALHTVNTGYGLQNVPTPALLAQMQAGAGPLAQSYLKKYPIPTSTTTCPSGGGADVGFIGCVNVVDPIISPQHNYFGRIDQNFSEKDRLSFTANFNWFNSTDKYNGGYLSFASSIPSIDDEHYWNMNLVETHVFNPQIINEFTAAHNRHYSNIHNGTPSQTDPQIIIDNSSYGGFKFGFGVTEGDLLQGFTQDRWQVQDNLGWTAGKHSFKFGGSYQYGIVYRNWDLGLPGYFEFGNAIGPTPAQAANQNNGTGVLNANGSISNINDATDSNFQHDFPYYQELSIDPHTGGPANAYRHYVTKDANLFMQDDWKISRRLTLNLGLRWDRYGAPTEVNGKIAQFTNLCLSSLQCLANARVGPVSSMWRTNNRDFGPRFGFAYDVFGDGKTAVRGGYGIFYDRIFDNVWSNSAWNPPFYALLDLDASGSDTIFYSNPPRLAPGAYVPDSLPGPAGRVSVRTMDVAMKDASVQNMFFGIEQQIAHDFLLRVNYGGSLGRHLPVLQTLNRYDGQRYNPTFANVRPNALYTGFNYRANNVNSNYNSLVTEIQKRFSHGVQFQASFTWSKLMDTSSDLFQGETTQGNFSQPYYYVSTNQNPKVFEYGPGAFDHTKTFKFNWVWELPFLRAQRGFLGQAFGGWTLSGFYQFYSGHPLEVYNGRPARRGNAKDANGIPENIGGDYNYDGTNNDRPVYIGTGNPYSGHSPADGIFTDNNEIGCGYAGAQSTNIASCNAAYGVVTPNTLFANPAGLGPRFGTLGRNVFRGPGYNDVDASLFKTFKATETVRVQFRAEFINLLNHPNFDGIDTNLNSSTFGRAQILTGPGITGIEPQSTAKARRVQLGLRVSF
ncbi:MAG: TonB-dependent receptor, partial [Acidobacteriaceae bacterium]|nr:TonB-dependent receptor [Acidobacteriaceae bacterium]